MKLGRLITAAAILTSSSAWADIAPPFSVHRVDKFQNTVDFVDVDKIKGEKVDATDLGPFMCNRDLGKKEEVVAVMPCPVDNVAIDGFELAVYDTDTGIESPDCARIPVTVRDVIAAGVPPDTTAISAIAEINTTGLDGTILEWIANVKIDAKIVKDDKSSLNGLNCVSTASSKAGTGLVNGNPISSVKLKIGKVKGGSEGATVIP